MSNATLLHPAITSGLQQEPIDILDNIDWEKPESIMVN